MSKVNMSKVNMSNVMTLLSGKLKKLSSTSISDIINNKKTTPRSK